VWAAGAALWSCFHLPEVLMSKVTTLAVRGQVGQTMAEYAVVLGVITIAVVVTLKLLSTGIKGVLTNVISAL
jgi:Flp pilus assembly pilin Flp